MKKYLIGDTVLKFQEDGYVLKQDLFMENFITCEHDDEIIFESVADDIEKYSKGKLLQKNGLFELYQLPEGNFIIYHWATCRFAFGFWVDDLENESVMRYYFNPKMKDEIPLDAVRFFSCSGMHSKLLQKDAVVFHSSYINHNGDGILFCGPSGSGKSTQAELWQTYENAEIVNGDRTLIKKKDEEWYAFGYPCCGSSAICVNKTLPLKAIVILEHGESNVIKPLSLGEKIKTLIVGSERYLWSNKELDKVMNISEGIVSEVPVIKFSCTPDKSAVEYLKAVLEDL